MKTSCCGASPLGEEEIGICSDCREHCDFESDDDDIQTESDQKNDCPVANND